MILAKFTRSYAFLCIFSVFLSLSTNQIVEASSDSASVESNPASSFPDPRYLPGDTEEFWAWDLTVMPPGFRRITARAVSVGSNSYVFVDESIWNNGAIDYRFTIDLFNRLEVRGLPSSIEPESAILPLQQKIFGALPSKVNQDPRVVILLFDMGEFNGHRFDGYFNAFDQMTEAEAQEFDQKSNEVNIIYLDVNPADTNDPHQVASIITHELQHLLSYHRIPEFHQEAWLSEASAEAAMMFSGYFTDQRAVERYALRTWEIPLVSTTYVHYGISALFSAFMVDKLGRYGSFDYMMYVALPARETVERAHYVRTGRNTSFDAIFSQFITYVYVASNTMEHLPRTWAHLTNDGYHIPPLTKAATIQQLPFTHTGTLKPYSFAIFGLESPLSPGAQVQVELLPTPHAEVAGLDNCQDEGQILWKPLPNAIAVYAVGCKFSDNPNQIRYKLSIRD